MFFVIRDGSFLVTVAEIVPIQLSLLLYVLLLAVKVEFASL